MCARARAIKIKIKIKIKRRRTSLGGAVCQPRALKVKPCKRRLRSSATTTIQSKLPSMNDFVDPLAGCVSGDRRGIWRWWRGLVGLVAVGVVGVCGMALAVIQPGGDGVVASLRLPDGAEYMVTQRCNWGAEPYTVALYTREKDGEWGWCYIDHEATRWRRAAMRYDAAADSVIITEQGEERGVIDRRAKEFRLHGVGGVRDFPQQAGVIPPYPFPE